MTKVNHCTGSQGGVTRPLSQSDTPATKKIVMPQRRDHIIKQARERIARVRAGRPPAPGHRQLSQGQEAYEGLGERDRTARRQRSTPRALIRLPKGAGKIVQKLRLRPAESKI